MKKSIEIGIHIFFWLVFIIYIFMLIMIYLQGNPDAPFSQHLYYVVFLELIMGLIFFYTTFLGIILARRKKENLIILAVILILLLLITAYPATRVGFWQVMSSVIPHVLIIFLALVFRKFSDSVRLENEKQALLLQNTQSELALLKMQVSPHFLFNTLNNIDYLISNDTRKASNSISKLGDILRYMIYDTEVEKIPLSKELKHIEDYIELIRLRTYGPDYLKYNVNGNSGNLQIAPMLFIPLIENAYKHSSKKEGENVIKIIIDINEKNFSFTVNNEYDNSPGEKSVTAGGIGLNLVRRRLDLIYPEKHTINLSQDKNRYNVELKLILDGY